MSGTYQDTSLGWQLRQLQQRLGEWVEYQTYRSEAAPDLDPSAWDVNWPEWLVRGLAAVLIGLIVGWLVWSGVKLLRPYWADWRSLQGFGRSRAGQAGEGESASALWRRAQALQQAGNYREACRLLYLAMVQHLHDAQLVENQPSRTNGEYLTLIARLAKPRPYQLLTRVHERLYFGGTAISAEVFQRCRRAYQEITKP